MKLRWLTGAVAVAALSTGSWLMAQTSPTQDPTQTQTPTQPQPQTQPQDKTQAPTDDRDQGQPKASDVQNAPKPAQIGRAHV